AADIDQDGAMAPSPPLPEVESPSTEAPGVANLDAALTRIEQAVATGAPYDAALSEAVALSGQPAPEALSRSAATGVPTIDDLTKGFGGAARDGYAASLKEEAEGDVLGQMFAAVQGRIGGRPASEQEGDDAGAVLSRISARLSEGRLDAAQAEAASLSEAVRIEMGSWIGQLNLAADGAAALGDYRALLAQAEEASQ
ncbi:MAG: hypothetical protein AAF401_10065, partial [Pseudomonadota bacterium]